MSLNLWGLWMPWGPDRDLLAFVEQGEYRGLTQQLAEAREDEEVESLVWSLP